MDKKPLYRRVNTRARGVHHDFGEDFRHTRHQKGEPAGRMVQGKRRGLDYTPLFRFLLSRVGADWDAVYSEAAGRLDRPDPIFWLVALQEADRQAVVRVGESSYFSGLYVDDDGRLQIVAPEVGPSSLEPACACCTHTLNGVPYTRKLSGRS